jgi:hypothetical protein
MNQVAAAAESSNNEGEGGGIELKVMGTRSKRFEKQGQ